MYTGINRGEQIHNTAGSVPLSDDNSLQMVHLMLNTAHQSDSADPLISGDDDFLLCRLLRKYIPVRDVHHRPCATASAPGNDLIPQQVQRPLFNPYCFRRSTPDTLTGNRLGIRNTPLRRAATRCRRKTSVISNCSTLGLNYLAHLYLKMLPAKMLRRPPARRRAASDRLPRSEPVWPKTRTPSPSRTSSPSQ